MKLIDTTHKLFSREAAIKIAAEMSEDDDWTYTPVHCPKGTGLSFIEVREEDGHLVGKV